MIANITYFRYEFLLNGDFTSIYHSLLKFIIYEMRPIATYELENGPYEGIPDKFDYATGDSWGKEGISLDSVRSSRSQTDGFFKASIFPRNNQKSYFSTCLRDRAGSQQHIQFWIFFPLEQKQELYPLVKKMFQFVKVLRFQFAGRPRRVTGTCSMPIQFPVYCGQGQYDFRAVILPSPGDPLPTLIFQPDKSSPSHPGIGKVTTPFRLIQEVEEQPEDVDHLLEEV